jgi:hypothetical protein
MRCYGVGWIKCREGNGGEDGILYLHTGGKEKRSLMTGLRQWGSKAIGLIYDTQDFANDLYLRMRVGAGLLCDG